MDELQDYVCTSDDAQAFVDTLKEHEERDQEEQTQAQESATQRALARLQKDMHSDMQGPEAPYMTDVPLEEDPTAHTHQEKDSVTSTPLLRRFRSRFPTTVRTSILTNLPTGKFLFLKNRSARTKCLLLFLAVLITGTIIFIVASLNKAPSFPHINARTRPHVYMWEVEDLESGSELKFYQNAKEETGVVVVEQWKNDVLHFVMWHDPEKHTVTVVDTQHNFNCYTTYQTASHGTGKWNIDDRRVKVLHQPHSWDHAPDSYFVPASPTLFPELEDGCKIRWWDVNGTDAQTPKTVAMFQELVKYTRIENFVYFLGTRVQTTMHHAQDFDRASFTDIISHLRWNASSSTGNFVTGAPAMNTSTTYPFLGEPSTSADLLENCEALREWPGLYRICMGANICGMQNVEVPPQGSEEIAPQCPFSDTKKPCRCTVSAMKAFLLPSFNQCQPCVSDGGGCECWARAVIAALLMAYSPCHEVLPADVHTHDPEPVMLSKSREACSNRITSECTDVHTLEHIELRGPVFRCFTMTYQYLLRYSRERASRYIGY